VDHDWVDEGGEAHGGHEVALERAALGAGTGDDGASSGGEGPLEEPHGPVGVGWAHVAAKPLVGTGEVACVALDAESKRVANEEPEDGGDEEVDGVLDANGPDGSDKRWVSRGMWALGSN